MLCYRFKSYRIFWKQGYFSLFSLTTAMIPKCVMYVDIWSFFFQWLGHVGGRMLQRRIGVGTHQLLLKSSTTRNGHKNLDQEKTAQNKKEKCVVAHLRQKEKCVCLFWAPLEGSDFLSTTTSWEQSHIVRKQLLEKSLFTIYIVT